GSAREIEVQKNLLDPHSIGVLEGPPKYGFRHLKSDEALVGSRSVTALRGLKHVESEFCFGVREGIVGVGDRVSKFRAQLRVEQRHRDVGGHAVAVIIGGEMRQGA